MEYCGQILHGDYSMTLKNRIAEYISCFRTFENTGTLIIPYISAWSEDENRMWYEFVSKRFMTLLGCEVTEVAEVFRNRIVERRIYKYVDVNGGITEETISQHELMSYREGLREEVKKKGVVEAIYKISDENGRVIWFKDQATVETFQDDKISLSLGCLTIISKEMEAEEALKRTEKALQEANKKLRRLATLDGLTQIANRRRFDARLKQEWMRLRRENASLSLILCDIDFFKPFNDTYGHQMGDDCLRAVAKAMTRSVKRPADLVARYGGEEFAVILPNTMADGAVQIAEDIKAEILRLQIPHAQSPVSKYLTLSLGVSSTVPSQMVVSPQELIKYADSALYEAKNQGRNRIVVKGLDR